MAHATVGSAQNLADSSAQALRALIGSLPLDSSGEKFTVDQVKRLSDKLSQLVGNDVPECLPEMRNDKGELVDEEGLPIIDITEPLQGADPTPTSDRPLMADPELVPLVSLSETEVERRRRERDRILDLLEEEERREQALIEEQEQEEKREAIIRRKNVSKFELEKLKAAKEMQKKMGKALLRNMAEAREREEKEKRVVLALDEEAEAKKKTLKAKKSVSFADLPPLTDDERNRENTKISAKGARFDWGDVTPAKLRATNRHTLLTKAQIEKHPMKMDVIERIPLGATLAEGSLVKQRDSDDESVPDTRISDNGETIQLGHDYGDDSEPVEVPPSLDSGGDEEPGNEPVEDECDLDMARHQREIALEYYEKRRTIGEEVLEAMGSNMPKEAADEWDQEEVPLEATLAALHPKPPVSKFKASRVASSYGTTPPSISLGSSVLPASSQAIQRAIRVGKLENDQLVIPTQSDTEEEEEEEGESMKEILELLKQGEMLEDIRSSSSQPIPASVETSPPSLGNRGGRANKQKTSRFKPTRSQSRPNPSSPTVSESSPPVTPVSHAGRSSPKVPSSPLDAMERQPSNSLVPPRGGNATLQPPTAPSSSNLMVVDSPSFRHLAPITPTAPSPAIMDSPSFRPPTVVAPSSFLPESSRGVTRPDRPPTVIRDVSERGGGGKDQKDLSEARKPNSTGGQKLSRFLAERM